MRYPSISHSSHRLSFVHRYLDLVLLRQKSDSNHWWLEYKLYLGEQPARFLSTDKSDLDDKDPPPLHIHFASTTFWSQLPKTFHSMRTFGIEGAISIGDGTCDAIVDCGAIGTLHRIQEYHILCEEQDVEPSVSECDESDLASGF